MSVPTPARTFNHRIKLPEDITYDPSARKKPLPEAKNIMLTGVLGYVGIHLLPELLSIDSAIIYCPVRSKGKKNYKERFTEALKTFSISINEQDMSRIHLFQSDLSLPLLGLSSDDYNALAGRIDVIYHSASSVNFSQPYSLLSNDNVQGLLEVLRFAGHKVTKYFFLLSSVAVYSWGRVLTHKKFARENADISENLNAVAADIGYVQSKWIMEKLTEQAANRGLPVMIFRLGYALYHSKTGISSISQIWPGVVKACLLTRSVPLLKNLRIGLTSIDYMVKTIKHIAVNEAALGKRYNVVPGSANKITFLYFFRQLEKIPGHSFRYLPYRDWVNSWCNDPGSPLYPLYDLFVADVCGGRSIVELYQDFYHLDNHNVRRFFPDNDSIAPTLSEEELTRYLNASGMSNSVSAAQDQL